MFAQRLVLDPVCGDPDGDRDVDTTAAMTVLIAAIGDTRCEPCVCDTGPPDGVTASDALRVLRKAVGFPDVISCGSCTSS